MEFLRSGRTRREARAVTINREVLSAFCPCIAMRTPKRSGVNAVSRRTRSALITTFNANSAIKRSETVYVRGCTALTEFDLQCKLRDEAE